MSENREVKSFRVKPKIIEKMKIIKRHLSIDTSFYNMNPHTQKLGYWQKGNVTNADVLEIAVNDLYDKIFEEKSNT